MVPSRLQEKVQLASEFVPSRVQEKMNKSEILKPFFFFNELKPKTLIWLETWCYLNVPKKTDISFENRSLRYIKYIDKHFISFSGYFTRKQDKAVHILDCKLICLLITFFQNKIKFALEF